MPILRWAIGYADGRRVPNEWEQTPPASTRLPAERVPVPVISPRESKESLRSPNTSRVTLLDS